MRTYRMPILLSTLTLVAFEAAAQAPPSPAGAVLWVRVPSGSVQELTAATAGSPRFALGFRTGRLQLGVGIGHVVGKVSERDSFNFQLPNGTFVPRTTEDEARITLFQVGPTVLVDFWRSDDSRTRANLGAGVGIGRLSVVGRNQFVDFPNGNIRTDETKTTGSLLGWHVSIGGDHFLHRNFAIGAEAGYQGTAAFGLEEEGPSPTQRLGLGANGTYVAVRATLLFGARTP